MQCESQGMRQSVYQRPSVISRRRRGTVMLLCIFVEMVISVMVLGILDSIRIQAATMTAVEEHEQSLYLAEAGIQHALSVRRSDQIWTGKIVWNDAGTDLKNAVEQRRYEVSVSTDRTGRTAITSLGCYNGFCCTEVLEIESGESM